MDRLGYIMDRLPHFYDKGDTSRLHTIVHAISAELELVDVQVDRLGSMVGIDTTVGEDLDNKWGALLNLPRVSGESDMQYRNRLKLSIPNLAGGTADAIRYAIAVALGINNDIAATESRIHVMDAWEYTGHEDVDKSHGCFVVTVDLNGAPISYRDSISQSVSNTIQYTKASGTKMQLAFSNYGIVIYMDLGGAIYNSLWTIRYNQLGGVV